MKWLTLEQIKQQLRIEQDFTDEDVLLEMYAESAEDTVLNICQRTYEDMVDSFGGIPQPIVEASLLLVAMSYEHRSPASQYQMYAVGYAFLLAAHHEVPEIRKSVIRLNAGLHNDRPVMSGSHGYHRCRIEQHDFAVAASSNGQTVQP